MAKYIYLLLLSLLFQTNLVSATSTPKESLQKLKDGNKRFYTDKSLHSNIGQERRLETAEKQQPYAIIVGCSDSRVAPEILFDAGIGDLFIVRVAGNVVGHIGLDSLQYAALYLNSSVILVLGHESCGAVKAVLDGQTKEIEAVAQLIEPAAERTKGQGSERLENTIKMNVKIVVQQIKSDPVLSNLMAKGKLNIVGGYYDFDSGKVEILN